MLLLKELLLKKAAASDKEATAALLLLRDNCFKAWAVSGSKAWKPMSEDMQI